MTGTGAIERPLDWTPVSTPLPGRHDDRRASVWADVACLALLRPVSGHACSLDAGSAVAFDDIDRGPCIRDAGDGLGLPGAQWDRDDAAKRGMNDDPEPQVRLARAVATMQSPWSAAPVSDPAYNSNPSPIGRAYAIDPARRAAPRARHSQQAPRLQ